MSDVYNQMDWGDPILPAVDDAAWEAEVKAELGFVPDIMPRVSPSPWLRQAILRWPRIPAVHFSQHLADIAALVTAQENACRYCYGIARSYMRLFGYSEKAIAKIERSMQMAEMDEQQRVFIRFCRNLARSNPRPSKLERDKLVSLGFSEIAVKEMAFHVANHCFINRVCTFVSCAPLYRLERMSESLIGRLMRPLIARQIRSKAWKNVPQPGTDVASFPGVVQGLSGVIGASVINWALKEVFKSQVLSKDLKVLMFAVVARSLECRFCQVESHSMAMNLGFREDEFEHALSSLSSPKLDDAESRILAWTRETVHYETRTIQELNRQMVQDVGPELFLEAIGVAAMANCVVRLAVIQE